MVASTKVGSDTGVDRRPAVVASSQERSAQGLTCNDRNTTDKHMRQLEVLENDASEMGAKDRQP